MLKDILKTILINNNIPTWTTTITTITPRKKKRRYGNKQRIIKKIK